MTVRISLLLPFLLISCLSWGQVPKKNKPILFEKNPIKRTYQDSIYQQMSEKERIGQLFIQALDDSGENPLIIRQEALGGIIILRNKPLAQIQLFNQLQAQAKVPLWFGADADAEMGLDSLPSLPSPLMLGATLSSQPIEKIASIFSDNCKQLGINLLFSLPHHLTGARGFGDLAYNARKRQDIFENALVSNKILFVQKNHTNTENLQGKIPFPKDQQNRQLSTYQDSSAYSLSSYIGELISKDQTAPDGLIVLKEPTEAKYFAVKNNLFFYPINIRHAIEWIEKGLKSGMIQPESFENAVKNILKTKYEVGHHLSQNISEKKLLSQLKKTDFEVIKSKIQEQAITLLSNDDRILPIVELEQNTFASVCIGGESSRIFEKYLGKYAQFDYFHLPNDATEHTFSSLYTKLKDKKIIIIGLLGLNEDSSHDFGYPPLITNFLKQLHQDRIVITVVFGNPLVMRHLEDARHLICTYENDSSIQQLTAQAIFGATSFLGKLPVNVSDRFKAGSGLHTAPIGRIGYALPESVGIDSKLLTKIDSIAQRAISNEATPGCQIVIVKDGKIVLEQGYGYTSYDKQHAVNEETIYDIASVTKVAASLQAVMRLQSLKKLDIYQPLSFYLPYTDTTNKGSIIIKDILVHQAGLKTFIPYWKEVMIQKTSYNPDYLRYTKSDSFPIEIIPNGLYAIHDIKQRLWKLTLDGELTSRKPLPSGKPKYAYSDLGYYFIQHLVEELTQSPLDEYVQNTFYRPMGLQNIGYQPLKRFNSLRIAPTEMDIYYRKTLVHGTVHDPCAALYGGVAGHAGLFSNAHNLAVLFQMNLQNGYYGAKQYIDKEVLNLFNTRPNEHYDNRRGIGWDKPSPNGTDKIGTYCSDETFGHLGFTGTCVWVDPQYQLVYVFLSNRVHPFAENRRLMREQVRMHIFDAVYKAMGINKVN